MGFQEQCESNEILVEFYRFCSLRLEQYSTSCTGAQLFGSHCRVLNKVSKKWILQYLLLLSHTQSSKSVI